LKRRRTLESFLPQNLETRRLVFVAAGLFLGSAVVTLVIVLATGSLGTRRAAPPAALGDTAQSDGSPRIGLSDLMLPPPRSAGGSPGTGGSPDLGAQSGSGALREAQAAGQAPPYLLREPLARWSPEQVQRYWIPLEQVAVDLIQRENDRQVQALFEGVP
jgi:hypothetical protein